MNTKTIFEISSEEYQKLCRQNGYRQLCKEEIEERECWACIHFRGGCVGEGCWCSEKICDKQENTRTLENNDIIQLK